MPEEDPQSWSQITDTTGSKPTVQELLGSPLKKVFRNVSISPISRIIVKHQMHPYWLLMRKENIPGRFFVEIPFLMKFMNILLWFKT